MRVIGFFGVSGMSSGSVLPAVPAGGKTSSNEKMSRSFSPGERVRQEVGVPGR